MLRFRWFKTKYRKGQQIKEWKLDKHNSFKPYPFHVIKVDMKTGDLWVYSHFNMVLVTFVGKSPKMTMSKRVFEAFKMGDWKNHWKDETEYYTELTTKEKEKDMNDRR